MCAAAGAAVATAVPATAFLAEGLQPHPALLNNHLRSPPAAPPLLQAKLHDRLGQRPESAHYHKLNLDRIDAEGLSGQDAVEALTFLADYHKVGCAAGAWMGWVGGTHPPGRLPQGAL